MQHIISNDLEVLAVTETWLSSDHGEDDLLNICPAGYNAVHTPRVGKRGGGVALIFRSSLRVEMASTGFSASSFVYTLSSSIAPRLSHLDAVMVSSSLTLLISSNC